MHHFINDGIKPKYNFRKRTHQKELIPKSVNLNDRDFILFACCMKIPTDFSLRSHVLLYFF